jgi:hypothetical protein
MDPGPDLELGRPLLSPAVAAQHAVDDDEDLSEIDRAPTPAFLAWLGPHSTAHAGPMLDDPSVEKDALGYPVRPGMHWSVPFFFVFRIIAWIQAVVFGVVLSTFLVLYIFSLEGFVVRDINTATGNAQAQFVPCITFGAPCTGEPG